MGRLAEILKSGVAPGYAGLSRDPQCADVAIPRALKEMERTQGAKEIAKGAGWSINQLKQTWKI